MSGISRSKINAKKQGAYSDNATDKIIDAIDIKTILGPELEKARALIMSPDFATDIKKQNEVVLLYRGMDIKYRAVMAKSMAETGSSEDVMKDVRSILYEYGSQYNKQAIDIGLPAGNTTFTVVWDKKKEVPDDK
jgi:hypothetical protein